MLFGGISIPYLLATLSYTLTSRVYFVVILLVIPIYGVFLLFVSNIDILDCPFVQCVEVYTSSCLPS